MESIGHRTCESYGNNVPAPVSISCSLFLVLFGFGQTPFFSLLSLSSLLYSCSLSQVLMCPRTEFLLRGTWRSKKTRAGKANRNRFNGDNTMSLALFLNDIE
jgi:hypothetical protein